MNTESLEVFLQGRQLVGVRGKGTEVLARLAQFRKNRAVVGGVAATRSVLKDVLYQPPIIPSWQCDKKIEDLSQAALISVLLGKVLDHVDHVEAD